MISTEREELRERLKRVLNPVYACVKHDVLDCPQCIYDEAEQLIHTEAKRQSKADQLALFKKIEFKTRMVECDCGLAEGLRVHIDFERQRIAAHPTGEGAARMAEQQNAKIDAAIKQAKGE